MYSRNSLNSQNYFTCLEMTQREAAKVWQSRLLNDFLMKRKTIVEYGFGVVCLIRRKLRTEEQGICTCLIMY